MKQRLFGPTRCSEILTEKYMSLPYIERRKIANTFTKYAQITNSVSDIRDYGHRCRVIDALKREAKHTVYNDIICDDEDIKQRLYYCIKKFMEDSI
jgi:hypothetical protein